MAARRGLAAASPLTRRRVSRSGAKALWKKGKAHKFTPAEAKRHGVHFDSDRGRQAALKMHAARRARNEALERVLELERRHGLIEEEAPDAGGEEGEDG